MRAVDTLEGSEDITSNQFSLDTDSLGLVSAIDADRK
jgi:hypothetical protein